MTALFETTRRQEEGRLHSFRDIPLPATDFGARLYEIGRELVRAGIRPARVMWDADEVLWDWIMDLGDLGRRLPQMLRGKIGHTETLLRKPGIFELLWGMRHEAEAQGEDPNLRIWTNGYAWRLWAIAQKLDGLAALLGLDPADRDGFAQAPNLFCRADYVEVLRKIWAPQARQAWLAGLSPERRRTVETQLARDPFDTTFKLPDFAAVIGKNAFTAVDYLVDDAAFNVRRFVSSGRSGVHAEGSAPAIAFSKVKNTAWRRPESALTTSMKTTADGIAEALLELADAPLGTRKNVRGRASAAEELSRPFFIEIPNEPIRTEWITPLRTFRQELGLASKRRSAAVNT